MSLPKEAWIGCNVWGGAAIPSILIGYLSSPNSPDFIVKMNECLDNNKFHILALWIVFIITYIYYYYIFIAIFMINAILY